MLYKTTCALIHLGEKVGIGTELDIDAETAKNFGDHVEPVGAPEPEPEPEPEKAISEMNATELKAKAEELGLATTGSKADLLERIALHLGQ